MLKHIDTMLQDWAEFQAPLLDSGGLGYPGKSPIATLIDYLTRPDSRPASTIVPFLRNTPDRVKHIDAVLRRLPDDMLDIVRSHHITRDYSRRAPHYRRLDALHHVVQGALLMLDS